MSDLTLMRAQGKVVTLIAAMLHGAGVEPMDEFANKLGVFAATVSEDDRAEGDILAYWAALVREVARAEPSAAEGDRAADRE